MSNMKIISLIDGAEKRALEQANENVRRDIKVIFEVVGNELTELEQRLEKLRRDVLKLKETLREPNA